MICFSMNEKLNEQFIINLSKRKNEPQWMLDFRLLSYKSFLELDNPSFGPKININFDEIKYNNINFDFNPILNSVLLSNGIILKSNKLF